MGAWKGQVGVRRGLRLSGGSTPMGPPAPVRSPQGAFEDQDVQTVIACPLRIVVSEPVALRLLRWRRNWLNATLL